MVPDGSGLRGRLISLTWAHDPTRYAPAKYRKACGYEAFIPLPLEGINVGLPGDSAGIISDAESAVRSLNGTAGVALRPFARILLRTESIASSKIEGLQVDSRSLARAEVSGAQRHLGPQTREVLANIDAMEM